MKKAVVKTPELSAKVFISFDKYQLKIWVENSVFAIKHIEIEKDLLKCSPPPLVTKLILLHTVGHRGMLSKCSKTINYKKYLELILYKPVGKYLFAAACIRALVMIGHQVINCLISQPKHKLWVLKRTVAMRRFF